MTTLPKARIAGCWAPPRWLWTPISLFIVWFVFLMGTEVENYCSKHPRLVDDTAAAEQIKFTQDVLHLAHPRAPTVCRAQKIDNEWSAFCYFATDGEMNYYECKGPVCNWRH